MIIESEVNLETTDEEVGGAEAFGRIVQHGMNPVELNLRVCIQKPSRTHCGIVQDSVSGIAGSGEGVFDGIIIVAVQ